MIVARALVAVVALELDVFVAGVLVDDNVRVNLGEVVSHLFYFFVGEVIIGKGNGTEIPRMSQKPAIVILIGYHGNEEKSFGRAGFAQFLIGKKVGVYPSSGHGNLPRRISSELAAAALRFRPASMALP